MTLQFLTAKSKTKDLHAQFGEAHTSCVECVELGISTITHSFLVTISAELNDTEMMED